MIGQVVALARNRGWEHDIVASFQLAVAVPSPRFRSINSVEICCSTDGDAWGLVMLQGFPVNTARSEETRKALQHLIPSGAKADSGGDSQRAESLNLWRQVLGGHGHGYSDRIAGGF